MGVADVLMGKQRLLSMQPASNSVLSVLDPEYGRVGDTRPGRRLERDDKSPGLAVDSLHPSQRGH